MSTATVRTPLVLVLALRSTPDIEHRVAGLQVEERVTGALALAEPLRGVVEVADQRSRIAARIHVRELRAHRHRGGRRPLLLGRFVTHPRAAPMAERMMRYDERVNSEPGALGPRS